jgi:hypothetical protein
MSPEQEQRVRTVFEAVLPCEPTRRAVVLDALCAGDAEVRSAVERLLADDEQADRDDFLTPPGEAPDMEVRLSVTEGPHQGEVFTFREHDTFIVGRSQDAHFRLPLKDKYFSRFQFLIEVNPPWCRLVDMASTNGTYVNGRACDGDRPARRGYHPGRQHDHSSGFPGSGVPHGRPAPT